MAAKRKRPAAAPGHRHEGGRPCGCRETPPGRLFLAAESDRLRACLVHAPGQELERLTPANYRFYSFDDLLDMGRAQEEHKRLRELLGRLGVRVDEFVDLLAEVYEQMSSFDQQAFLERMHTVNPAAPLYVLRELSRVTDARSVARALVEGIDAANSFAAEVEDALYHFEPMANLVFMQDAAVVLLDRVVQGYMSQLVRLPEEVVVETVIRLSRTFGPRGTGEFWLDPSFRQRHHMHRRVESYQQVEAARMSLRIGSVEPSHLLPQPLQLTGERVRVEIENAYMADGRHFILEGGNLLALRRTDGTTVVLIGHNARTSADAIDELAFRLLREKGGRKPDGEIASVVVVDFQDASPDALHLDARMVVLAPDVLAVDRSLVESPTGPGARFYLFEPEPPEVRRIERAEDGFRAMPRVALQRCGSLEDALARAGLDVQVRWIPERAPWEAGSTIGSERWVGLQQAVFNSALNALVVAPHVLIGLDRHERFYREELGAVTLSAEREVFEGPMKDLECCELLAAVRKRGKGKPVVLLIHGDELSRARGGPRSLVMPLVREAEA